jgi:hypothetical protein
VGADVGVHRTGPGAAAAKGVVGMQAGVAGDDRELATGEASGLREEGAGRQVFVEDQVHGIRRRGGR